MKGQCIQPITVAKSTKGSKTSDDLNLREAKKNRSKSQDPPNSKNSSDMKTKKGDKEDVRSRGKENAKEVKDNKNNKDNKKNSKDNQNNAKEKQTTSPKKGRRTNDEQMSKQEKNNQKPEKGREAYSKDDMEIEKNKKQKRKEHNEKAHKSIQTDTSTLKSRDDHSVHYGNQNGGYHGYPDGDSEVYGHRKSDANSDSGYFRDSTGCNSYNDDGNIRRGFKHHFSREMLEQSADELKTTVEELEKRFDAIENEDEDNEYASGNEWKTRFETQTEMNQQLERQILMLENKVEESKKNLKDAGKSPQEGQLFIDLADANPQMVKQLEKEKLGLINSIRDLEWRLDQESKAYHRANDERKQYVIEIQSTKGNIYQIQRQRAAGDSTYRTPRVENGGNIPDDQRILDPKKGPIRKTAGVKTLPSLDSV